MRGKQERTMSPRLVRAIEDGHWHVNVAKYVKRLSRKIRGALQYVSTTDHLKEIVLFIKRLSAPLRSGTFVRRSSCGSFHFRSLYWKITPCQHGPFFTL